MIKELQDKLYEDFPELFAEAKLSMQETCMCWGCECTKYWEPAIRHACQRITDYYRANKETLGTCPPFIQVKEKFGTLRIYAHSSDDETFEKLYNDAIREAEIMASQICERCGAGEAILHNFDGWYATACPTCIARDVPARPGLKDSNAD